MGMDITSLWERVREAEEASRLANETATAAAEAAAGALGGGVVALLVIVAVLAAAGTGLGLLIW